MSEQTTTQAQTPEFIWDHTVTVVNDLNEVERTFADHGLTAAYGGKHVGHGTENALAYFGVNYVEFLALYNAHEAAAESLEQGLLFREAAQLLPGRERFYRPGLRVHGIEQVAQYLHGKGIVTGPVIPGNRTTSDGQEIRWKLLWILSDTQASVPGPRYPFILDWLEDEETHRETLERSGLLHRHPLGEVSTQRAVFTVSDPEAVAARWSEVFGFAKHSGDGYIDLDVAEGRQWRFVKGTDKDPDTGDDINEITELRYQVPQGASFDIALGSARFTSL
jgi:hypothetical protein